MDRVKLAELRKKKADKKAFDQQKLLDSNASIKEAILALDKTLNKSQTNSEVILGQIKELKSGFGKEVKQLENALAKINKDPLELKNFDKLLDKVGDINNQDVVEAVNNLTVRLEEQSISQDPKDFQPVRRVRKVGQRLVFDDDPSQAILGGGGGSGGIQTSLIENDRVKVSSETEDLAVRLDNTESPVLYIGKAVIGSAEDAPVWQIAKLDTESGLVKTWSGGGNFTQVWDDRGSLVYE